MKKIFVFPGQGSQKAGMLTTLANYGIDTNDIFQTISDACEFDVRDFLKNASMETLSRTEHTQIATFSISMGYWKILNQLGIQAHTVAGHSIGQYAALVSAGVLDLYETSRLIKIRSELMSTVKRRGRLCAVSSACLDLDLIEKICRELIQKEDDCLQISLYNSNRQIVVGGTAEAIERFKDRMDKYEGYRSKILPVGQAFHTELMYDMSKKFKKYVEELTNQEPRMPVVLNCTGEVYQNGHDDREQIKNELVQQCHKPVMWLKTMEYILGLGESTIIEVGSGKSLGGMFRNLSKAGKVIGCEDRKSIMKMTSRAAIEAKVSVRDADCWLSNCPPYSI